MKKSASTTILLIFILQLFFLIPSISMAQEFEIEWARAIEQDRTQIQARFLNGNHVNAIVGFWASPVLPPANPVFEEGPYTVSQTGNLLDITYLNQPLNHIDNVIHVGVRRDEINFDGWSNIVAIPTSANTSGLEINITDTPSLGVNLNWSDSDGEDYYIITRDDGINGPVEITLPANTTEYFETPPNQAEYSYQVTPVIENDYNGLTIYGYGISAESDINYSPPSAATNLSAIATYWQMATISWNPIDDADEIKIYRNYTDIANPNEQPVAVLSGTATQWQDHNRDFYANDHFYRVESCNMIGSSNALVIIPKKQWGVSNFLTYQSGQINGIEISWTDRSAYDSGYFIERKLLPDGPWTNISGDLGQVETFVDENFQNGQSYEYRVTAYSNHFSNRGESWYGNTSIVNVPAIAINNPADGDNWYIGQNYQFSADFSNCTIGEQWSISLSKDNGDIFEILEEGQVTESDFTQLLNYMAQVPAGAQSIVKVKIGQYYEQISFQILSLPAPDHIQIHVYDISDLGLLGNISWASVNEAHNFRIFRSTDPEVPFSNINDAISPLLVDESNWTDTFEDVPDNTETDYFYRVVTYSGVIPSSSDVVALPQAISSISASIYSTETVNNQLCSSIQIDWEEVSSVETNIILKKSISTSAFELLQSLAPNVVEFIDEDVEVGQSYEYYVRTVWSDGNNSSNSLAIYSLPPIICPDIEITSPTSTTEWSLGSPANIEAILTNIESIDPEYLLQVKYSENGGDTYESVLIDNFDGSYEFAELTFDLIGSSTDQARIKIEVVGTDVYKESEIFTVESDIASCVSPPYNDDNYNTLFFGQSIRFRYSYNPDLIENADLKIFSSTGVCLYTEEFISIVDNGEDSELTLDLSFDYDPSDVVQGNWNNITWALTEHGTENIIAQSQSFNITIPTIQFIYPNPNPEETDRPELLEELTDNAIYPYESGHVADFAYSCNVPQNPGTQIQDWIQPIINITVCLKRYDNDILIYDEEIVNYQQIYTDADVYDGYYLGLLNTPFYSINEEIYDDPQNDDDQVVIVTSFEDTALENMEDRTQDIDVLPHTDPNIIVTSPSDGEEYSVGEAISILWDSTDLTGNVNIDITQDNGNTFIPIEDEVPNTGVYKYIIPSSLQQSKKCFIRVSSSENENIYGDSCGNFSIISNVMVTAGPSPFNPVTTINIFLPSEEKVSLKIYDILGREVATLVEKNLQTGKHSFIFDGSNLSSGVYLYCCKVGKSDLQGKITLLK